MTGTTWKTPYAGSAMSILLSIISGLVAIGAGVRLSLSDPVWPILDLILVGGSGFVSGLWAMRGMMLRRSVDHAKNH
jgi:hypothetical protein